MHCAQVIDYFCIAAYVVIFAHQINASFWISLVKINIFFSVFFFLVVIVTNDRLHEKCILDRGK